MVTPDGTAYENSNFEIQSTISRKREHREKSPKRVIWTNVYLRLFFFFVFRSIGNYYVGEYAADGDGDYVENPSADPTIRFPRSVFTSVRRQQCQWTFARRNGVHVHIYIYIYFIPR